MKLAWLPNTPDVRYVITCEVLRPPGSTRILHLKRGDRFRLPNKVRQTGELLFSSASFLNKFGIGTCADCRGDPCGLTRIANRAKLEGSLHLASSFAY